MTDLLIPDHLKDDLKKIKQENGEVIDDYMPAAIVAVDGDCVPLGYTPINYRDDAPGQPVFMENLLVVNKNIDPVNMFLNCGGRLFEGYFVEELKKAGGNLPDRKMAAAKAVRRVLVSLAASGYIKGIHGAELG